MDDAKWGVLQFLVGEGESIAAISRKLRLDRKTVKLWLPRTRPSEWFAPVARRQRVTAEKVVSRRKLVEKLLRKVLVIRRVKVTPVQHRESSRVFRRRPFQTSSRIARQLCVAHGVEAHPSTIRRDIAALGFRRRRRPSGPPLTQAHIRSRMKFAKDMLAGHGETWLRNNIIFTDETQLDTNERGSHQYVKDGEVPDVVEKEQGAPRITLWGAIGINFRCLVILDKTNLTKELYQQRVLEKAKVSLQEQSRLGKVVQQDNARPHCGAQEWMRRRRIEPLAEPWPPRSCDLNPIEGVWNTLKDRMSSRAPFTHQDLKTFVKEEWESIACETLNGVVSDFFSRLKRCKTMGGKLITNRRG